MIGCKRDENGLDTESPVNRQEQRETFKGKKIHNILHFEEQRRNRVVSDAGE